LGRKNREVTYGSDPLGLPAAAVPAGGLDPRVALASTLQATSTTAVLLGSGVSITAGVPTGWQVMRDLIRRIASASGETIDDRAATPEEWWAQSGRGEPRYDEILEALAPTDPDRRHLLRRYFDADPRTGVAYHPAETHRVIAELAARGRISVIITTNFDRLMEHALEAAGIEPQVLFEASQAPAMTPLVHTRMTVIKLHGDYASGALRNAPNELETYPKDWRRLLRQVFDEYGLLVVGWSAEWDAALADALHRTIGRRYAWYWATYRGETTEKARRLITQRGAHVIDTTGADELFLDLERRIADLDRVAFRQRRPREAHYINAIASTIPLGWREMPLVVVRISAGFATTDGDVEPLLEGVRKRLVAALNASDLTTKLTQIESESTPVTASPQNLAQQDQPDWSEGWEAPEAIPDRHGGPPRDVRQSAINATYRYGTDGSSGISGRAHVGLPQHDIGGELRTTIDVGISRAEGVGLDLVVDLLNEGVLCVSDDLRNVIAELAPAAASTARVEVHWDAPFQFDSMSRPVPPQLGVDFAPLGHSSQTSQAAYGGYAENLTLPVSGPDTIAFIRRAITIVATNCGFLEPTRGLDEVFSRAAD